MSLIIYIKMTNIKKTDHAKGWRGYETTGIFIQCWWEYKMI